MPTKPTNKLFINYELEEPKTYSFINKCSDLYKEIANYGTSLLDSLLKIRLEHNNKNLAQLCLLRHALNIMYSISECLKIPAVGSISILTRSLFEAQVSIKYILKSNTDKKSQCFIFCETKKKFDRYSILLKSDPNHKNIIKTVANDKTVDMIKVPENIVKKNLIDLKNILDKPEFKEIAIEYDSVRQKNDKKPSWYELFNGPKNILTLASDVGDSASYEVVYRVFSGQTHASELFSNTIVLDTFKAVNMFDSSYKPILKICISYALNILDIFIKHEIPTEEQRHNNWYLKEIRNLYNQL